MFLSDIICWERVGAMGGLSVNYSDDKSNIKNIPDLILFYSYYDTDYCRNLQHS